MLKPTFRPPYTLVAFLFRSISLIAIWLRARALARARSLSRRIAAAYLTIGEPVASISSGLVPRALHPVSVLRTCRVGANICSLCDIYCFLRLRVSVRNRSRCVRARERARDSPG